MTVCQECGRQHPKHSSWCSRWRDRTLTGEPYLWVAHYPDWSSTIIFTDELEALRYAVRHDGMRASKVRTGVPIEEQVT